jgi:excisionase family DNA binding protein
MKTEQDKLLGLKDAASYLGVSRYKLYLLAKAGDLPYYTTPLDKRRKLFRREDLDALKKVKRAAS